MAEPTEQPDPREGGEHPPVPWPPTPPPAADGGNASEVLLLVYDELRALARHRIDQERAGHTLQATALVHEAFMRLAAGGARFGGKAHFFHAAADAMRKILIEHARRRGRLKRGGGGGGDTARRVPLSVLDLAAAPDHDEILAFDEALERLAAQTPQAAAVVRLRFYAGASVEETAAALGVSERTVNREWTYARAWLFRVLRDAAP